MAEAEKAYMQSPLVLWVETFKANDGHPLEYKDLYDGVFLNDVMHQIDPRPAYDSVNRHVEDVSVRLHNWDVLVKNLRGYYSDVLQQLLVLRLPNITAICRDPSKESSFAEIRRALLLVLGCAVQCEQKESFIDKIMAMDITAQTEIVENIKEVTDDCETVLSIQRPESPTSHNAYVDKLFHHLYRLIRERDQCAELACDLGQERDYYMSQAEGRPVLESPQLSPDKHHLALELAECKAKLRHLRQELEDRQEQLSDVKDELHDSMANTAQLKHENASLLQEARATRSLRDELDILKEKASKMDLYEKEILRYKERLNELEFYKARTEELKEDNSILEETKAMLEDQLEGSRKRIETVVEMESEMRRYRQQAEELVKERESEREKLEYLTEENARLEFEKKSSMNESAGLESELSAVRSKIGNMGSSLSGQLSETSHARVLRLELENQRLAAQLAEMKESALIHSAEMSLEMEKENQRLAKKVEKLQSSACESSEQAVRAESELTSAREEKARLAQALDAFKDNAERQILGLEKENEQLGQALDNIRERSEKTSDARVKDLERENKRLHEAVTTQNAELSKLEFEHRQVQRSVHQLDDNRHRLQELEQENQGLEKDNSELHQKLSTLQHMAERVETVEQESSDLSCENRKLQRTVESLQAAQGRREQLEQEHISLKVEHQRFQRTIESLKSEADRAVELETEKDELNQQLQQLRKSLEGQKTHKLKQEQMEFELIDTTNEKQRLQKSVEVTTRRLHQLEKDNLDIETENDRLTKEVDGLKVAVKRLEERDREAGVLDGEVVKLGRDKATLEKENRKLKQSSELKESALEELNAKFQALDKESKAMRRTVDKMKETSGRVKDLEKENAELLQELNTDRRTLAALREDLVNEKIRSQELSNDLEQLNSELEKVGINTQKLTMAEQTNDANRYKVLETMIEDTLQKSSELKEEKIRALETRLEQSKGRNLKLQDELRLAQRESDGLRQRVEEVEEKVPVRTSPGRDAVDGRERFVRTGSSNATKELFQLKDHLVELERSNAKLLTDTDNLRSNNSNLTDQCKRLETQLSNLQTQNASMHGHYSSLKEQDAKLQVEHSTLQSQLSSQLQQQEGLKTQLARLEVDRENLLRQHDGLQATHSSLVADHESLQRLHEQLTVEYEGLMAEHGSLKGMHKGLKSELKESQERLDALLQGKDDVNKLRTTLEQDRQRLQRELSSLGPLQGEHARLKEDHTQMRAAYDKLSLDYSQVLNSHKQVKTDYNNLQLKATELQGELNEAKENMSVADVEFQKLENKIETVYQINERIENENQALLLQIKQLLNQNHDLLTQALNSKDHFAEEEKAYLEKLSDLRRQKERLEEKIMDHYKNRISPKKKGLGALIARKARGIISRGPRRSKSRNNLAEGMDNSSQGSGSTEHINDGSRKLDDVASLISLQSFVILGAKSTENVNEASSGGDNLLPGVGRPYVLNEEGAPGQRSTTPGVGRRTPGRSSPGSEMLTLDQFLKEANKGSRKEAEPSQAQRRPSNDSESKGSDNSNNSNSRRRSGSSQPPDVAASATSLLSPGLLGLSRDHSGSRLSAGSGGANDNSSLSSGGGGGHFVGDVFITSTPKTDQEGSGGALSASASSSVLHSAGNINASESFSSLRDVSAGRYMSHKRLSGGDDWRSSSQESSPYASTSRMNVYAAPVSSSSPRDPPPPSSSLPNSHTTPSLSSQHHMTNHNQPSLQHYQAGNLKMNNNNSNNYNLYRDRELPPVPKEPPPPIPATDRLDRLTMLATPVSSRDQPNSIHHQHQQQKWPPNNNSANSRGGDNDDVAMRRQAAADISRRMSHGPGDLRQQHHHHHNDHATTTSSGHLLPDQFQPPVPRSQPPSAPNPSMHQPRPSEDSSVVSGHNPSRPHAALVAGQSNKNHNNHPLHRARPASAMGPSPHVRGVISRPPGEGRPRQQHRGQGQLQNAGANSSTNQQQVPGGVRYNSQPAERPKSVPPHMFNPQPSGDEAGRLSHRGENPPPPPMHRSNRDEVEGGDGWGMREAPDGREPVRTGGRTSSVSLLREPSRSSSRGPPSSPSDSHNSSISSSNVPAQPLSQQANISSSRQYSQQLHHQESSYNGDVNKQQHQHLNSFGRPVLTSSSQQFSDQRGAQHPPPLPPSSLSSSQHQQHSTQGGPYSSFNGPRQQQQPPTRPGQQQAQTSAGPRPDSLTLGPHRSHPPPPPPQRSQSSMGHPVSTLTGGPFSPTGGPPGGLSSAAYGRSITPGPHPVARRDSAPPPPPGQNSHYQHQPPSHPRDAPRERQASDPGRRLPPSGAPQGHHDQRLPRHDSSGESSDTSAGRHPRPREPVYSSVLRPTDRPGYPSSSAPRAQNSNIPPPGLPPQPQQHRTTAPPPPSSSSSFRPGLEPTPTTNGPHSLGAGYHHPQHSTPPAAPASSQSPYTSHPEQQVPPQIRSQGGRPVGNHHTPPNRQVGGIPSSPSPSSSSLLSPDAVEGQATAPAAPAEEREGEEKGQAKKTSSIWYEYGCV